MQVGLSVRLNPRGGNLLNMREALRLILPPQQPQPDAESDSDSLPDAEARRLQADEYDLNDQFIDDDQLIHPQEEESSRHTQSPIKDGKANGQRSKVYQGFGKFWVNQGPVAKGNHVEPIPVTSVLGNVVLDNVPNFVQTIMQDQNSDDLTYEEDDDDTDSHDEHDMEVDEPEDASAQPSQSHQQLNNTNNSSSNPSTHPPTAVKTVAHPPSTSPTTAPATAPSNNKASTTAAPASTATSPNSSEKPSLASLHAEIHKLANLCTAEFGDKKPKLNHPKVQEQLDVIFRQSIACSNAKLYSDIAKDRRVVALSDNIWERFSFLRVKRANLETLGHALLWNEKEKQAIKRVSAAESEIETLMKERRKHVGVANEQLVPVRFDAQLDALVHKWYKAKVELQESKNQLGSRVKAIKKCIASWALSLKKTAFQNWSVAEAEIVDAYRRVEDERLKVERARKEEEKQRREAERIEKKRKREEALAAAAAKRAAMERINREEKEKKGMQKASSAIMKASAVKEAARAKSVKKTGASVSSGKVVKKVTKGTSVTNATSLTGVSKGGIAKSKNGSQKNGSQKNGTNTKTPSSGKTVTKQSGSKSNTPSGTTKSGTTGKSGIINKMSTPSKLGQAVIGHGKGCTMKVVMATKVTPKASGGKTTTKGGVKSSVSPTAKGLMKHGVKATIKKTTLNKPKTTTTDGKKASTASSVSPVKPDSADR